MKSAILLVICVLTLMAVVVGFAGSFVLSSKTITETIVRTEYQPITETSTVSIVQLMPSVVNVSGFIETTGTGTKAIDVNFTSGGDVYAANVTNRQYSVDLPFGIYNVTIDTVPSIESRNLVDVVCSK
jgi:hypothetical protein